MAFDFPASPTNGQVFTSGGVSYVWNGQGWVQQGAPGSVDKSYVDTADALKVAKAGDTMSGPLVLPADPSTALQAAPKQYVDAVRAYAAPFDALAYNGMQINGSMEVNQERGIGGSLTLTNGGVHWVTDAWTVQVNHGPATVVATGGQQNAGVPGLFNHSSYITATTGGNIGSSANDIAKIAHNIEGYRIARLAWGGSAAQPITIGFHVYSTIAGTLSVAVSNYNDRTYITNVTVGPDVSGWQYKTITVPGCTNGTWNRTNGTGMAIAFSSLCGSNWQAPAGSWQTGNKFSSPAATNLFATNGNSVYITGVAILPGTQAPTAAQSPTIMRPYDQELVTCRRYFAKTTVSAYHGIPTGGIYFGGWASLSTMRTAPTVTYISAPTSANLLVNPYPEAITEYGFRAMSQSNTTTQAHFLAIFNCDARL